VSGSYEADNAMITLLHENVDLVTDRPSAIKLGLEAWGTGKLNARRRLTTLGRDTEEDEEVDLLTVEQILKEELAHGKLEVGLLERKTPRESKFRLLRPEELAPVLAEYR
jgi:hypothetical protein